jgi:hypothetical protein
VFCIDVRSERMRRAIEQQRAGLRTSGFAGFCDAAGTPVQVLVVSDGHGGSRYVRSDVGARLACEVALRTVEQTLRTSRTGQAGSESEWRQWLAETLPQAIVQAWLEEVQRHWQAQGPQGSESVPAPLPALAAGSAEAAAAASPAGFSPIPYGATLGLLVLTPRWWGYTGLGDWDLVQIEADLLAMGSGYLLVSELTAGGVPTAASLQFKLRLTDGAVAGLPPLQAAGAVGFAPVTVLALWRDGLLTGLTVSPRANP